MNKEKTTVCYEPVIIDGKLWYKIIWEIVDKNNRSLSYGVIDYYHNKSDALEFVKLCANHGIPKSAFMVEESC